MINWRVRIKNRAFWLALIPAALLLLQQALRLCDSFSWMMQVIGALHLCHIP